jgi:hypothetical protein
MDVPKVEPASCCETCLTDTHDGNGVTADIKLETGTEVEDEEDPLLITSPDIKTEPEVSFLIILFFNFRNSLIHSGMKCKDKLKIVLFDPYTGLSKKMDGI